MEEPGDGTGKKRLLSDRAVLKLMLWLVAGVLAVLGASSMAAGAGMRYVSEEAVRGPVTCGGGTTTTTTGDNGSQAIRVIGSPCSMRVLKPAETSLTQAGWNRMVGGGSAVALALVLLFYQALRWPPDKVGAWLPRRQPASPSETGTAPAEAGGAGQPGSPEATGSTEPTGPPST